MEILELSFIIPSKGRRHEMNPLYFLQAQVQIIVIVQSHRAWGSHIQTELQVR